MKCTTLSERALVFAPRGRDASIAVKILDQASIASHPCESLKGVVDELNQGAAMVVVTEEALATVDFNPLAAWLASQEEWSDLPFVLLTNGGGGLEKNPSARRYLNLLGNVIFLERPFHPATLVSLARAALRGRRRQYEARARLEALVTSEARFRAAVGAVQGVLWTNDRDGRMRGAQPGWQSLTGQTSAEYQDFGWAAAVHPDDAEPTKVAWQKAVSTGAPFIHQHRVRRASDGAWRIFSIRAIPSLSDYGSVREWVGVHTDVTEEHRAADVLRESEERFRTMADNAPVMIWVTDAVGNCTYLNRRWHEYTGQTAEQGLGLGWTNNTHPDDRVLAKQAFQDATCAKAPFRREYRLRRADGSYRWSIDTATPRLGPGEEFLGYVGSVIDIDERKEIENALRTSESQLRNLNLDLERRVVERALERGRNWLLSPEIMGVLNAEGFFETSNPAWTTVLGWTEQDIASTRFLEFVHPDDMEKSSAAWEGAMHCGQPALRFENRYRTKAGPYRWLSWIAVPNDGKVYCTARDVTAEKEQGEALALAEEALRQAQKMEAVGQLTGGVAHDFNNLLTIIKSSSELLRRPDLAEERRRRYVDAISETVDRGAKLTGQLLAFARRQALKPEVFDVAERIEGVTEMLRTIMGSRVNITMQIAAEKCHIEADLAQFETAIVNMAVNARDAMDGEGTLAIQIEVASRRLAGKEGGAAVVPFVCVSLQDSGAGIQADKLAQIFEPFYTTKAVGKGTGLGLSQVYGFVKQSGGDIEVKSEPGQGATFKLLLPRVTSPDEPNNEPVAAKLGLQSDSGNGRRVLVVEDNAEVGRFSRQLLEDLGYLTQWANNGAEALELLEQQEKFDVVFSDVIMPGMSGIDLGREIRRRYPQLPFVLTSGYSHVLAEEGRLGFELLQKPYAIDELSHVLSRVIRARGTVAE